MGSTESDWRLQAERSVLLEAVSHWRRDPRVWFEGSYSRLPETLRVNPLSNDFDWIEGWLNKSGAVRIPWFTGPGSAWELPFERGAADGDVRLVLNALHETGRVTRQEAVSMLPVLALDPQPADVVLDLCASPGSKTTQICEHIGDLGAVVANEVVSGRVNTLVSNVQRHGSKSTLVVQHDGRHIPKVPGVGFDRVLVDVPCTGSGTTRKNPEVWRKWLPSSGRSLQDLQYNLVRRAIAVTKPGGRIVYSTCSLDPVENEGVVARILSSETVSIVDAGSLLEGVPSQKGMDHWEVLDDNGKPIEGTGSSQYGPPSDKLVSSELGKCLRVWNDSIGGGGFFLAVLKKDSDGSGGISDRELKIRTIDELPDPKSFPRPIGEDWSRILEKSWGSVPNSMWERGKSLIWSTEEMGEIWKSKRTRKSGRVEVSGGRWRPLKVIHLGLIAAKIRHGELDRLVSRGARRLLGEISSPFAEVDSSIIDSILMGEEPLPESVIGNLGEFRGGRVLFDGLGSCLPVWIGSRVTPMISDAEKTVMRSVRGLPIVFDEEE